MERLCQRNRLPSTLSSVRAPTLVIRQRTHPSTILEQVSPRVSLRTTNFEIKSVFRGTRTSMLRPDLRGLNLKSTPSNVLNHRGWRRAFGRHQTRPWAHRSLFPFLRFDRLLRSCSSGHRWSEFERVPNSQHWKPSSQDFSVCRFSL